MDAQPLYSRTLNREVRPGTPCPICGESGHLAAGDGAPDGAALPLRCPNGHTITMVRMPVVPSE
ncbi:MAG TPA: hypothetical protein VEA99_07800 [Gemmatimonadaceae bacterium]|nr:hypothetical protein [Gemmatimonadaceae bacterium]